ncbi:MAG: hypothetical protein HRT47_07300 [Candidatus Caenarcaniphilales bacterium]|nr:hypothetical protein [Candidatus Caenarcaniphilales bacterium]
MALGSLASLLLHPNQAQIPPSKSDHLSIRQEQVYNKDVNTLSKDFLIAQSMSSKNASVLNNVEINNELPDGLFYRDNPTKPQISLDAIRKFSDKYQLGKNEEDALITFFAKSADFSSVFKLHEANERFYSEGIAMNETNNPKNLEVIFRSQLERTPEAYMDTNNPNFTIARNIGPLSIKAYQNLVSERDLPAKYAPKVLQAIAQEFGNNDTDSLTLPALVVLNEVSNNQTNSSKIAIETAKKLNKILPEVPVPKLIQGINILLSQGEDKSSDTINLALINKVKEQSFTSNVNVILGEDNITLNDFLFAFQKTTDQKLRDSGLNINYNVDY